VNLNRYRLEGQIMNNRHWWSRSVR